MKRFLPGVLVVAVGLFLASNAMAYNGGKLPNTGINSTVHDLSKTNTGMSYNNPDDSLNRICIFCHAPHNAYRLSTATGGAGPIAPAAFDYLPLWNHNLSGFTTAFAMYDNGPGAPQSGAKASQARQNGMTPGSTSLLCLSCHDGTIAANQYGNTDQLPTSVSNGSAAIVDAYKIGKDKYLGNHHPIGFSYDDAYTQDTELRNPDAAALTPTTFVRDHLYGSGNTMMECGTCHSVHNTDNTGERLLWRSDQNSELCLTCHAKGDYTLP